MPGSPVQALALPALVATTRIPLLLLLNVCRSNKTGAATTTFLVKTPAAVQSESETNKTAAEQFNKYLGLSPEIIKPDTSITDNDLNTECVVLFGRPSINKISKRFEEIFPIAFNGNTFIDNGISYSGTSQGLAQITEHPLKPKGQFILYAGLSASAMLQFGDLYLYDAYASYVIFDRDKQLVSGDWEYEDSDLVWTFE